MQTVGCWCSCNLFGFSPNQRWHVVPLVGQTNQQFDLIHLGRICTMFLFFFLISVSWGYMEVHPSTFISSVSKAEILGEFWVEKLWYLFYWEETSLLYSFHDHIEAQLQGHCFFFPSPSLSPVTLILPVSLWKEFKQKRFYLLLQN